MRICNFLCETMMNIPSLDCQMFVDVPFDHSLTLRNQHSFLQAIRRRASRTIGLQDLDLYLQFYVLQVFL